MSRTGESRSAPDHGMAAVAQAVVLGMLVMLAGTLPRNILFAANLRLAVTVPWAVPVTAAYLWRYWRYLGGQWEPADTSAFRRQSLRANRLPARVWIWALLAGGAGLVALVFGLGLANRLVLLPPQQRLDLTGIPHWTIWSLLLMSAPVAGIVEEAAFRGYMQGPIERSHGLFIATLITGTMFALAHLDFTWILWPYYVAVAALYGTVTYLTNSIWPAIVLHTGGNVYSNTDLLLHGRAEWQAPAAGAATVWVSGIDSHFVRVALWLLATALVTAWAFARLAATVREGAPVDSNPTRK